MSCNDLGFKLVSFQFNSEKDMRRVLDMEPWQFNKHVLVLRRMTDKTQLSAMVFNQAPIWMRIYDLPGVGRDENTVKQIADRFGEVIELDKSTMNGFTRSIRVKVNRTGETAKTWNKN